MRTGPASDWRTILVVAFAGWAAGTLLSTVFFELVHGGGRTFSRYQLLVRSGDQMLALFPLLTGAGLFWLSQLLRPGLATAGLAAGLNASLTLALWPNWGPRRHGPELVVLAMHAALLAAWLLRRHLPSPLAILSSLLAMAIMQTGVAALFVHLEPSRFGENFGELAPFMNGPGLVVALYAAGGGEQSRLGRFADLVWAGILLFVLQAGMIRYLGGDPATALPLALFLTASLAAHPLSGLAPARRRQLRLTCLAIVFLAWVAATAAARSVGGGRLEVVLLTPSVIAAGGTASGVLLYATYLLAKQFHRWIRRVAEPQVQAMATSSASA